MSADKDEEEDLIVLVWYPTGMWPGESKPKFLRLSDALDLAATGRVRWPAEQPCYLPVSNLPKVPIVTTQGDFDHHILTGVPDGSLILVHEFQAEILIRKGKAREPTAEEFLALIESLPDATNPKDE